MTHCKTLLVASHVHLIKQFCYKFQTFKPSLLPLSQVYSYNLQAVKFKFVTVADGIPN